MLARDGSGGLHIDGGIWRGHNRLRIGNAPERAFPASPRPACFDAFSRCRRRMGRTRSKRRPGLGSLQRPRQMPPPIRDPSSARARQAQAPSDFAPRGPPDVSERFPRQGAMADLTKPERVAHGTYVVGRCAIRRHGAQAGVMHTGCASALEGAEPRPRFRSSNCFPIPLPTERIETGRARERRQSARFLRAL